MTTVIEHQFADGVVLMGSSRDEIERTARVLHGITMGPDHQSPY